MYQFLLKFAFHRKYKNAEIFYRHILDFKLQNIFANYCGKRFSTGF